MLLHGQRCCVGRNKTPSYAYHRVGFRRRSRKSQTYDASADAREASNQRSRDPARHPEKTVKEVFQRSRAALARKSLLSP